MQTTFVGLKSSSSYFNAYLVSFSTLAERFSFWGLQAALVLFLLQEYSLASHYAFALVGIFGGLSYAASLMGGLLADKFTGIWRACLLGLLFSFTGNLILYFSSSLFNLHLSLTFLLLGSGLFSPSSNNILRELYSNNEGEKETAFLISCVAGNISGSSAPLIYGIFGAYGYWHTAFLFGCALNCIAFCSLFYLSSIHAQNLARRFVSIKSLLLFCLFLIATFLFAFLVLHNLRFFSDKLHYLLAPFFLFCLWLYYEQNGADRARILFLLYLTFVLFLFYTAVFQIYSSLTLFITHYVNREIMGLAIPVPAFAALICIFFIVFAPLVKMILAALKKKGIELSLLSRVPIGLTISVLGFVMFAVAEYLAIENGSTHLLWIVLGNLFLGLGEVILYPPILTAIATFSPEKWAGTFMGVFSISVALSSFLSGQLAFHITKLWQKSPSIFNLSYGYIAFFLSLLVILSTIVFSKIKPWYMQELKIAYKNDAARQ